MSTGDGRASVANADLRAGTSPLDLDPGDHCTLSRHRSGHNDGVSRYRSIGRGGVYVVLRRLVPVRQRCVVVQAGTSTEMASYITPPCGSASPVCREQRSLDVSMIHPRRPHDPPVPPRRPVAGDLDAEPPGDSHTARREHPHAGEDDAGSGLGRTERDDGRHVDGRRQDRPPHGVRAQHLRHAHPFPFEDRRQGGGAGHRPGTGRGCPGRTASRERRPTARRCSNRRDACRSIRGNLCRTPESAPVALGAA